MDDPKTAWFGKRASTALPGDLVTALLTEKGAEKQMKDRFLADADGAVYVMTCRRCCCCC